MKQTVKEMNNCFRTRIDNDWIYYLSKEKREDMLHTKLAPLLENNPELKLNHHFSCANKYCSSKPVHNNEPLPKRLCWLTKNWSKDTMLCPVAQSFIWI